MPARRTRTAGGLGELVGDPFVVRLEQADRQAQVGVSSRTRNGSPGAAPMPCAASVSRAERSSATASTG